jgi:hypothetical protein
VLPRFFRDYDRLTQEQRQQFIRALSHFIADLTTGIFRPGLRVKRIQGTSDVWEMTWAPNGRATWQYGDEQIPGQAHVIWRRIGTHDVFGDP